MIILYLATLSDSSASVADVSGGKNTAGKVRLMVRCCAILTNLLGRIEVPQQQNMALKHLKKALQHFERQEMQESIQECEDALRVDPTMIFAHAVMGQIFNHMHEWSRAVDSWRNAAKLDADNHEFYYHLGFSLHQVALDTMNKKKKHGLNTEAIDAFNNYLRLAESADAPQSQIGAAHSYLGNVYKSIKTRDKQELAKDHFMQAVNLDPTNELAFFNIGLLYVDEYEKTLNEDVKAHALENINRAIELSPSNTHFSLVRDALLGKVSSEELMMTMQHSEL